MKIGILTFHEGLNHGAYLQAYCTMLTVRALGHDPVIINYKNREHWLKEDVRSWLIYRRPVRFWDRWQKQRAFKRDQKKLPLTSYTRNSDEVRKWHFDVVIVGSDVVWDTGIFGFDSLYFGDLNTDRRIAYAASCGGTDGYGVDEAEIQAALNRFDQISVRDLNTKQIVAELTSNTPQMVLDPVFLLEDIYRVIEHSGFKPAECTRLEKLKDVPFLLVYGVQYSREDIGLIREFAQKRKLKVISVGNRTLWADESIVTVGPLGILRWFGAAEYVFSSTFHGCIFAICCEKNFAVRIHPTIRNKVTSLLDMLGIPERGVEQLSNMKEVLDQPIDYSVVNDRLLPLREFSHNWLATALQACEP